MGGEFDDFVSLSRQAKRDLNWIICHLKCCNGKSFKQLPIDLVIVCDASNSGWGAVCEGIETHGEWSLEELELHINAKELLAAFFAVQSFYPLHKNVLHIRLKIDNSTAVPNINNYGSIKSPTLLSREFWDWCLQRQLHLSAESIPRIQNCIADRLSRQLEKGGVEWCLNNQIFRTIRQMTFEPSIDLFASRLNAKVGLFVSWHPEPGCHSVDAFNLCWTSHQCYAFPPFCLIGRALSKLQRDNVQQFLLIAPIWPTDLVPGFTDPVSDETYPPTSHEQSTLPSEQANNSSYGKEASPLRERGVSEQSAQLVCSSWSKGTEKQYRPAWQKWCSWCSKEQIDPLQATPAQVANFLSVEFGANKSYSTPNLYRSAISSTLHVIEENKIGKHPIVSRCMKGIYVRKTPTPRYQSTWDVSKVTSYLSSQGPLQDLTLKPLTLKTVMLCSLVCAQREQTLCLLDLNNKVMVQDAIKFIISDRHKTARPGKIL